MNDRQALSSEIQLNDRSSTILAKAVISEFLFEELDDRSSTILAKALISEFLFESLSDFLVKPGFH